MNNTIKKEWFYEQAPSFIWEYLTRADLLSLWLMPNNFEPVLGHEFQFTTKPMPPIGLDGVMHCKVLEIVTGKKLVYSWKAGSGDGTFSLDTIVEWILEPSGKGTKLHLKQTGFNENNLAIYTGMTNGWEELITKMANHLNENTSHD